jgi:hypothetical protein
MDIDNLYKIYGQQMVQKEILDGQIAQTKQALANAINEQNAPKSDQPQPETKGE